MNVSLKSALRDPFVQFLLAGVIIFAAFEFFGSDPAEEVERRIALDASALEWIHANFSKQYGRPPTAAEMEALVNAHIRNEVKYREAVALGLDAGDSIVRRRMMQKYDFLFGNAGAEMDPDPAELERWYVEHGEAFRRRAVVSFEHRWFSPDGRGAAAADDAAEAVLLLNDGEDVRGDVFPQGDRFEGVVSAQVRAVFGPAFAEAVFGAGLDEWIAIESGLGAHAVKVLARTAGELPALDDVREVVVQAWREAESERVLEETTLRLMKNYDVRIDDTALRALEYTTE